MKYAGFDHTAPAPQPVTGWYDCDQFTYTDLPAAADLLALSEAEWASRLEDPSGWAVQDAALVRKAPARAGMQPPPVIKLVE